MDWEAQADRQAPDLLATLSHHSHRLSQSVTQIVVAWMLNSGSYSGLQASIIWCFESFLGQSLPPSRVRLVGVIFNEFTAVLNCISNAWNWRHSLPFRPSHFGFLLEATEFPWCWIFKVGGLLFLKTLRYAWHSDEFLRVWGVNLCCYVICGVIVLASWFWVPVCVTVFFFWERERERGRLGWSNSNCPQDGCPPLSSDSSHHGSELPAT